jgi:hypothetical protein
MTRSYLTGILRRMVDNAQRISNNSQNILFSYKIGRNAMRLKCNIGRLDQVLRIMTGLVLIYVGFLNSSIINDTLINNVLGIFGVINIAVGFIRICPVYYVANISTLPDNKP